MKRDEEIVDVEEFNGLGVQRRPNLQCKENVLKYIPNLEFYWIGIICRLYFELNAMIMIVIFVKCVYLVKHFQAYFYRKTIGFKITCSFVKELKSYVPRF